MRVPHFGAPSLRLHSPIFVNAGVADVRRFASHRVHFSGVAAIYQFSSAVEGA